MPKGSTRDCKPVQYSGPSIEQVMVGIDICRNPENVDERLFIECKIDNHSYKSLVDSGAEICLIGLENVKRNHSVKNITAAAINVSGIGGNAKVYGKINLEVNIDNSIKVPQSFIIVEELANELLLGADFIRRNKFIIDMENNKLLKHEKSGENTTKVNVIELNGTEIRLSDTIDLKPQYSTVASCELNERFRNKVNVFAVGIFPDSAIVNENLMIQSSVINSDCESLLMPMINCFNDIIQLKAGTIVAYAQKLVKRDNGELAESGFEWIKKEVNSNQFKKSESFMEMFRMDEAKLTIAENKRVELLLNKFKNCISLNDNDVGLTSTIKHNITLSKDTGIKQPICRVNGELAEKIEDILKQDHKDGII
ncbi:unnamed protein product [Rotaria magnacalcarata]|uniref:Peptidase A2 domain-containing protein n=1 Tax=Rotaria magnacalcarata TaxID=392030 RepID=A0A820EG13_9BILA|nr:unnamed protein product [Rotaria magnacalcarata]CAF4248203.1 unnamed protein product [Rotaria magnacalcarata]